MHARRKDEGLEEVRVGASGGGMGSKYVGIGKVDGPAMGEGKVTDKSESKICQL